MTITKEYTGKDIETLPFPSNVRVRPEMYIGPTDTNGMLTAIREIVNNSVDEFLAGYCNQIILVKLGKDHFKVIDNGRGVPFDLQDDGVTNTLLTVFGSLHSGRNFKEKTVYSTGLNGVGSSVVNALSSVFAVTSRRNKDFGTISFIEGTNSKVVTGKIKNESQLDIKTPTGTSVQFKFDMKIFSGEVTNEMLISYLKEVAYLNTNLKVVFLDSTKPAEKELVFHYTDNNHGLQNYINDLADSFSNENSKSSFLCDPVIFSKTVDDNRVEVAFTYSSNANNRDENIISFCNTIKTSDGGTHVTGFKRSFTQNLLDYITTNKLNGKVNLEADDLKSGLIVIVSVFTFNPKYSSQTKQKLTNTNVSGSVTKVCNEFIKDWTSKNGKVIKALTEVFMLNAKGRIAQQKALEQVKKESSTFISSVNDVNKYAPCIESGDHCELFIVEGKVPNCFL